jgi:hypothetical protein
MSVKQWEYRTEMVPGPADDPYNHAGVMAEIGLAGWELCACGGQDTDGTYRMFFKRPKKQPTIKDILPPR